MKIALDVMGGDFAPVSPVDGALLALKDLSPDDKIVLVGDEGAIVNELKNSGSQADAFEIVHASEVIQMAEQPTTAISRKKDSSINIGYRLLKEKKVDAFISAGNTGAMLVGAVYIVNALPGILRPCIPTLIPKESGGYNLLLDVGSNPDCKPDVLYQFALIGSVYASKVLGIDNPKVGLVSIGEEEGKGNLLTNATYQIMKGTHEFNFVGNVEARDTFGDVADVLVCDGFTGNIILKQIEAFYTLIRKRKIEDEFFNRFNYENYGGTPILGINSISMIGHGISNANAFKNMILESKKIYEAQLIDSIGDALQGYIQKV